MAKDRRTGARRASAGESGGARKPRAGSSAGKRGRALREASFPDALAALLRARRIRVPSGLLEAPRHAYASQPPSFVEQLAQLPDRDLKVYAEKIASYVKRQEERARRAWESSPLIAELRRRRLPEPPRPQRAVGASVSLAKPLAKWSDDEIIHAADEWSRMGQP